MRIGLQNFFGPILLSHTSIANGSQVGIGPAVGVAFIHITILGEATANATYNFGLLDGLNTRIGTAGVSGAAAMITMVGVSNMTALVQNSGTASGFYNYAASQWII